MKKGIIAIILAALCAAVFLGIRYLNSDVETQAATQITYEEKADSKCFFIRNEQIYRSETTGTVYHHYTDGSRVKKNSLISTIYQGKVADDILQELGSIDKKIASMMTNTTSVISDTGDSSSLESRIDTYRGKIIESSLTGDSALVAEYKNAINNLRQGKEVESSETIETLQAEKSAVEAKIGGEKKEVYSDISGIFTTVLDGLEYELTLEKAQAFSVEQFNQLKVSQAQSARQVVTAGESICKVVNNHEWYILLTVPDEKIKNYEVGTEVNLRFEDMPGEEIKGKLYSISEPQDNLRIVLIKSTHYLEGAFSLRESKVSVIFNQYTGYKVPVSAIRTQDDQTGIIGETAAGRKFYPCKVLYTDQEEQFVIIQSDDSGEEANKNNLEQIDRFVISQK